PTPPQPTAPPAACSRGTRRPSSCSPHRSSSREGVAMTRHEVPVAATGVLRHFAAAAMIAPADFHMARRMGAMRGEDRDDVLLAFALATRELRLGSVCLDLREAHLLAPETEL